MRKGAALWAVVIVACGDASAPRPRSSTSAVEQASSIALPPAPEASSSSFALASDAPGDKTRSYLTRFIPVACAYAIRCGPLAPDKGADCELGPGRSKVPDAMWAYFGGTETTEMDAEIADHRYRFDDKLAKDCVDALERQPCHGHWDVPEACDPLLRAGWVANVPVGGSCRRSDSCVQGYCAKRAEGGVCVPYLEDGTDCVVDQAPCRPPARCKPVGHKGGVLIGRCQRRPISGERCTDLDTCADGSYCAGAGFMEHPGTCKPLPGLDEPCGQPTMSIDCVAGLFCDINDRDPRCRRPLARGATCRSADACGDGLTCTGLVLGAPTLTFAGSEQVVKAGKCARP